MGHCVAHEGHYRRRPLARGRWAPVPLSLPAAPRSRTGSPTSMHADHGHGGHGQVLWQLDMTSDWLSRLPPLLMEKPMPGLGTQFVDTYVHVRWPLMRRCCTHCPLTRVLSVCATAVQGRGRAARGYLPAALRPLPPCSRGAACRLQHVRHPVVAQHDLCPGAGARRHVALRRRGQLGEPAQCPRAAAGPAGPADRPHRREPAAGPGASVERPLAPAGLPAPRPHGQVWLRVPPSHGTCSRTRTDQTLGLPAFCS